MADGGITKWIFDGRRNALEFREVGEEGATRIQKRKVTAFARYLYYTPLDGVVPADATGNTSRGNDLYGEQGGRTIKASRLISGDNIIWVCSVDDNVATEVGLDAVKRVQRWETRGDWSDFSWPTG